MKKLLMTLAVVFAAQGGAFAYWGLGVKAGGVSGKNDDFQNEMDYQRNVLSNYSAMLDTKNAFAGAELFIEGNGANRLGLSLGINGTGETTLDEKTPSSTVLFKANAQSIPLTLYWKHKGADSAFSFRLGGGADIMKARTKTSFSGSSNGDYEFKQTKVTPHVDAGVEWYIFKRLALGINIGYLFNAKFEELKGTYNGSDIQMYTRPGAVGSEILISTYKPSGTNNYCQDYTGVRGDIALRYYFGGAD